MALFLTILLKIVMTKEQLQQLEKDGWEFKYSSWTHPHDNKTYVDLVYKSRRMNNFSTIYGKESWDNVSYNDLMDHESDNYARQIIGVLSEKVNTREMYDEIFNVVKSCSSTKYTEIDVEAHLKFRKVE